MKYPSKLSHEEEDENVSAESSEFMTHAGVRITESAHRTLKKREKTHSPQFSSNPFSRWRQKQTIKKQYAAAKTGRNLAETIPTVAMLKETIQKKAKREEFFKQHSKGFFYLLLFAFLAVFLLNLASSCSVLVEGGISGIGITTYPSADADMLSAEAQYCALEDSLQRYLNTYESTHSYDEYHYDLDVIGHDPYNLISMITALVDGEWTADEIGDILALLFEHQYTLTETVESERRYRTEIRRDENGDIYRVRVPYTYYICTVTLENTDLSHLSAVLMNEEQRSMYAMYMATLGNRPDLFPDSSYIGKYVDGTYIKYEYPPEVLEDEVFAAMIEEAEKYLGYPYVWGGSSPSTSFDCSGFVSWVLNHSGWDVGRQTANSLLGICTPITTAKARPGDLIFFEGTYDTNGASHVGIYVGDGMMLHCGDPIQYTSINTSYWQQHFLTFARLP